MKRIQIITLLIMCTCLLAGCKNGISSLKVDDIKVNTLLVKEDGSLQAGIVEDFNKDYYSKEELTQFIEESVSDYTKTAGEEAAVMDSLEVKGEKVNVIFHYATVKDYATLNEVETDIMTAEVAVADERMPDSFVAAKDSATVEKEKALGKKEYKVIVVNEPMDVIVQGNVVYYANGILVNKTTVQSSDKGATIIVYK